MIPKPSVFLIKQTIGFLIRNSFNQICKVVVICLVLFFCPQAVFCQDTEIIRLAAFPYPPFFSQETDGSFGIGVDLGNALFKRLGFETELTMLPLKRALLYLENGAVDAIMILVRTAEREPYLIYSAPLMPGRGYIWSAADRKGGPIEFECFEKLRPYRIGVTIGYSYGRAMDEFLKSVETDSAPIESSSFKKLMNHRIDLIPASLIITTAMIKKHPEFHGKFVHSSKPFFESAYHMGINKKSKLVPMMPLINKIIADMKAEGVVEGIVKKYTG